MSKQINNLIEHIYEDDKGAQKEASDYIKNTQLTRDLATKRKKLNITQKDMAEKLGVSQGTVSNFETKPMENLAIGELFNYLNALGMQGNIVLSQGTSTPQSKYVYHIEKAIECLHQMDMASENAHMREGNLNLALEGVKQITTRSNLLQLEVPYQEVMVSQEEEALV